MAHSYRSWTCEGTSETEYVPKAVEVLLRAYCRQYKGELWEYAPMMGYAVRTACEIDGREWFALKTLADLFLQQIVREEEAYDLLEGWGWIPEDRKREIDDVLRGYAINWTEKEDRIRVSHTTQASPHNLLAVTDSRKDTLQRATRFCIYMGPRSEV
jgi:hypothetical protein